jgi:CheY-like chemotaxis protein
MNTNERLRILYIEDNSDSIDMLTILLEMSDIEVICAKSVSEGIALAAS